MLRHTTWEKADKQTAGSILKGFRKIQRKRHWRLMTAVASIKHLHVGAAVILKQAGN